MTIQRATSYLTSCDFCEHQDGRHFCLFHDRPMKNMDISTCDDWTPQRTTSKIPEKIPPIGLDETTSTRH